MSRDAVVATYELVGRMPLEDCARVVAMEQSTGTWTPLPGGAAPHEHRLAAWVESTDTAAGTARIAFPLDIFEATNIAGVLSIVAGNLFGLGSLQKARLLDIEVPPSFAAALPGPKVGIQGIRHLVGTTDGRPHGGTIVKPKVGLDPKGTAARAKEAALGGVDLIKDDETLTDQAFCPIDERARLVLEALDQAHSETGHRTLYALNVTAGTEAMLERWDRIQAYGPNCVMIDVLTAGFDALVSLRKHASVPIHVHRTMHGALTRSADFGIDMMPICRLVRLCGGDQLHIGSATGKMEHPANLQALVDALRGEWHGKATTFPVSSGGLHPALVAAEVAAFGKDVVLQAGGGIHGHPGGSRQGAKAFMDAIRASHAGIAADRFGSPELDAALAKWRTEAYEYHA